MEAMMFPDVERRSRAPRRLAAIGLACGLGLFGLDPSRGQSDDDVATADSLAAMLRAARTVVSRHQAEINDPNVGDKGLTATRALAETKTGYREATGEDADAVDPATRRGRLLRAQMDAIKEVFDVNQATINEKGVAFKGFIPSTFARLVNEAFGRRAGTEASVKVTAPPELIRNLKADPDAWEQRVIAGDFLKPDWPKGKEISAVAEANGRLAFRLASPEYYTSSCLSCHGTPKGDIDITGYPKEGGAVGDLGGVISIALFR
jgi:hypothetical protein